MANSRPTTSQALKDLRSGLGAVDDVLGFAKDGRGKPTTEERSLFVASVALSYAVWENYVEEVAIEATAFVASQVTEGAVPESVQSWIMKSSPPPTAWDLVVHPGWRELWVRMVRVRAKGDATNDRDFGILTANSKAVSGLFDRVGVDPFVGVTETEQAQLDQLVVDRGHIVHTGKAPENFRKANATGWRSFVEGFATKVDLSIASEATKLAGARPW
jgi:hypothetical protein